MLTMAYGVPRADYIAGARAMLDWLEAHPDTNLPSLDKVLVALTTNVAVETWAQTHGMTDSVTYDNEGNASADVEFGPVKLHVYGYRDFDEHKDRLDGRTAESYAEKHGLALVDAPKRDKPCTCPAADCQAADHVDYDEIADVLAMREEMALEAAGVESWDQL